MVGTNNSSAKLTGLDVVATLARRMIRKEAWVRSDVAVGAALELLGILLGIAGPYVLKLLVDGLNAGRLGQVLMIGLIGAFVVSWAGANVLAVWRMVYSTRVMDRLTEQLATAALAGALPAAVSQREGHSGETAGQLERLPFSLMIIVDGLIWRAGPLILQVLGSLWLMSGLIPLHYAAIMASVLAGYVWATWFGAVQHQRHANLANQAMSNVSRNLADVLHNARRVVLNGATMMELNLIRGHFKIKIQANTAMMWALVRTSLVQYGLVGLGLLLLLALGCQDVAAGHMTVGDFVLLQAYAFRLASPLSGFGFILSQAAVSLANVADVMNQAADVDPTPSTVPIGRGPAAIRLRSVSFSYGQGLPGLDDITTDIPAGSFAVIVGPNGSGKSTLAQLMAGIMEPATGEVWVGDERLSAMPSSVRYAHVLYIPQATGLFSRSLLSNALYPPTAQTEHGVTDLLAQWNFYEAGRQIDLGAEAGEQGERLSGGQIQKLELARIAGISVPALILDETTSALDPASEQKVIDSLLKTFDGKTTLVLITHRAQLAEMADKVLFMKGGRLVRQGRHETLLRDSASYAALWRAGAAR